MTDGVKRAMRERQERFEQAKAAGQERLGNVKAVAGERVEAAKASAAELQARVKPKLRGVIHEYAFPISLLAGLLLVLFIANSGTARVAFGVYALSLSALLGTSALYHRVDWRRPSTRRWMRRLDHSMIFLLIAGTVTPFLVLMLDGPFANGILIAVWLAAIAGVIVETVWMDSPKWVSSVVYVAVGLIGGIALPAIIAKAGLGAGALIAIGGILYIAGAIIYALQRPDPRPAVFGYHEIFHTLVVAAAAAHFAAIALYAGAAS